MYQKYDMDHSHYLGTSRSVVTNRYSPQHIIIQSRQAHPLRGGGTVTACETFFVHAVLKSRPTLASDGRLYVWIESNYSLFQPFPVYVWISTRYPILAGLIFGVSIAKRPLLPKGSLPDIQTFFSHTSGNFFVTKGAVHGLQHRFPCFGGKSSLFRVRFLSHSCDHLWSRVYSYQGFNIFFGGQIVSMQSFSQESGLVLAVWRGRVWC